VTRWEPDLLRYYCATDTRKATPEGSEMASELGGPKRTRTFEWTKPADQILAKTERKQLQKRDTSQSVCDGRPSVDT
jgi:hypothetical protein